MIPHTQNIGSLSHVECIIAAEYNSLFLILKQGSFAACTAAQLSLQCQQLPACQASLQRRHFTRLNSQMGTFKYNAHNHTCMSYWCLSNKQNHLPRPAVSSWYCLPNACTVRTTGWHRYRYVTCVWASISRLTVSPSCLFPRTVTRRVSGIKYIVNQSSPTSPTCRHSNSSTSVLLDWQELCHIGVR